MFVSGSISTYRVDCYFGVGGIDDTGVGLVGTGGDVYVYASEFRGDLLWMWVVSLGDGGKFWN